MEIVVDEKIIDYLLEQQYDREIMREYQIYHDCGKPYCRTVDDEGRQHFVNHAEVSAEIYEKYFDNQLIKKLIKDDMNFHYLKSNEMQRWFETIKDTKYLCSLYITAWAEIISNSVMFGGKESVSYKIKRKSLISAGKKLLKFLGKTKN